MGQGAQVLVKSAWLRAAEAKGCIVGCKPSTDLWDPGSSTLCLPSTHSCTPSTSRPFPAFPPQITQIYQMDRMGYNLVVHPHGFVVHRPHLPSAGYNQTFTGPAYTKHHRPTQVCCTGFGRASAA